MKLFFQNSIHQERLISEPNNKEEVINAINEFLDDHNFKSYYMRVWEEEGRLQIDVGIYSEFFFLEGMTFDEWKSEK